VARLELALVRARVAGAPQREVEPHPLLLEQRVVEAAADHGFEIGHRVVGAPARREMRTEREVCRGNGRPARDQLAQHGRARARALALARRREPFPAAELLRSGVHLLAQRLDLERHVALAARELLERSRRGITRLGIAALLGERDRAAEPVGGLRLPRRPARERARGLDARRHVAARERLDLGVGRERIRERGLVALVARAQIGGARALDRAELQPALAPRAVERDRRARARERLREVAPRERDRGRGALHRGVIGMALANAREDLLGALRLLGRKQRRLAECRLDAARVEPIRLAEVRGCGRRGAALREQLAEALVHRGAVRIDRERALELEQRFVDALLAHELFRVGDALRDLLRGRRAGEREDGGAAGGEPDADH
jgi:hypothetical protein